jgi:hypothetical protein
MVSPSRALTSMMHVGRMLQRIKQLSEMFLAMRWLRDLLYVPYAVARHSNTTSHIRH